jgi:enoyl-CoA hydratase/carnithine racemase
MVKPANLDEPGLTYEKVGTTAVITINRPDRGNALTAPMRPAITEMWRDVRDDPAVRVAIVTGAGDRHFCTGVDVGDVDRDGRVPSGDGPVHEQIVWSPHAHDVWKPVICAVNGLVAGGGLHFVVDADIVVATTTAAFMDTHTSVGMVGAVENIGLARRAGIGAALRMTLCGRSYRMPAQRAYELGLVDELAPPGEALAVAQGIADEISKNSPAAVAASKRAIWGSLERPYTDALEHGWALARAHWSHPDFKEGPRAFVERRAPKWTTEAPT